MVTEMTTTIAMKTTNICQMLTLEKSLLVLFELKYAHFGIKNNNHNAHEISEILVFLFSKLTKKLNAVFL